MFEAMMSSQLNSGPRAAILTSKSKLRAFNGNHSNFQDIIRMGEAMGVLIYVIVPCKLCESSRTLQGYVLAKQSSKYCWVRTTLPWPDVVYNRIPTRQAERDIVMQGFISRLCKFDIPIFNGGFFDKLTLCNNIASSGELSKYLPETVSWGKLKDLQQMIDKHDTLYLKPIHGLAGAGIIKITFSSDDKEGWELVYQLKKCNHRYIGEGTVKLYSLIKALTGLKSYIIQQGISLSRFNDKIYDVRILVQKNDIGEWDLTGMGVRVAGEGSITTHVPRGGSIADISAVLQDNFGNKADEKYADLTNMALSIAEFIDSKSSDHIGEMSLDVGIDEEGNIWFFEANSKPMKFDEPIIRVTSLERIVQYMKFLSMISNKETKSKKSKKKA